MNARGSTLIPAPQTIRRTGGRLPRPPGPAPSLHAGAPLPAWITLTTDNALARGGYTLELTRDAPHARITSADAEGRRNALATLRQLLRSSDADLPELLIEDAPAIPTRGVMLDVSRDRIPTMRELFDIVETVAELKCNHLQLYFEHTFAYPGHDTVWTGCSPITPEELRRLDTWCSAHAIDLCANQNCFGHLSGWLRTPGYEHLAETHDEYDFYGIRRKGPFSLCPTDPRSLDLVREWLDILTPLCSGPVVNIGCDETADIGSGRSAVAVRQRGAAAVYYDFVEPIARHVRALRKRPMLWADIALSHPEAIERFPSESVAGVWGYEADTPFAAQLDTLAPLRRERGVDAWVCPGTSSWRSITGRTRERRANLNAAARAAAQHAAPGYLICDWGDVGHRQVWPVALRAIAEGLSLAWNPAVPPSPEAASRHALRDPTGSAASWLDNLGDADAELREASKLLNATALFSELHPARTEHARLGDTHAWREIRARIQHLRAHIPNAPPLLEDELRHAADHALLAADIALARRGARADVVALRARLSRLIAEHRRLWLARSRTGGLQNTLAHDRGLFAMPPLDQA